MQRYDIRCRKAEPTDDAATIALYMHLTDPYIYPAICEDPADPDWIAWVESGMKTEGHLFSLPHLSVAEHRGTVVGAMCVIPCGQPLTHLPKGPLVSPPRFSERLAPVVAGYFAPLIAESQGYRGHNITNLCVDPRYRNAGVGRCLLAHAVDVYGSQEIHLDVVAGNDAAIHLYERFGFVIAQAYHGFSGTEEPLPCYHMIRMPNTAE